MFPIAQVNSFKRLSTSHTYGPADEQYFHTSSTSQQYVNSESGTGTKHKSDAFFGSLLELSNKLQHANKRYSQIAHLYGVSISGSDNAGTPAQHHNGLNDLFPAASQLKRIGSQHEMREKYSLMCGTSDRNYEKLNSASARFENNINTKVKVPDESSNAFVDYSMGNVYTTVKSNQHVEPRTKGDVIASGVSNSDASVNIIQCAENPVTVLSERRKHHCAICGYQTDNISHLRRHQCTVHNADKLYHCYICGMDFSRSERAKSHFLTIHPEIPYHSKMARKRPNEVGNDTASFARDIRLQDVFANIEPITAQKPDGAARRSWEKYCKLVPPSNGNGSYYFQCLQCDYQGPNIWLLKRHYLDVHVQTGSYSCRVCHYSTGDMQRLISHMTGHGELFCIQCSFSTVELDRFRAHLPLCNGTSSSVDINDVPQCPVCGDEFNDILAVKHHVSIAHQRDYCELCGCVVYGSETVEEHQRRQHAAELNSGSGDAKLLNSDDIRQSKMRFGRFSNQVYYCPVKGCDFKATWKKSVELHTLNYHGCASIDDCNSTEPGQLILDQSQTSINGLFNCAFCPNHRTFKYRKSFEKHLLQHGVDYEKHPYLVVRSGPSEINDNFIGDQMSL